jgi:Polyketide cyclase / dehydrase and lipid transport
MMVLYIILGIIAALLLAGLVIPKGMKATREIVINKPNAEVFNYIKQLKNQDSYSKWGSMDPTMKKEYKGTDGTVGFVSAWEGNKKVGAGEQEITGIEEGRKLQTELRFLKPFKSVSQSSMTTEAITENSTKVSWGFEGNMNYPLNVMKIFMNMEKAIGNDFAIGLSNLKKLMEK